MPDIRTRIARKQGQPFCTVPGCGRPTMAAANKGLASTLCKRHVALRARHGSAFAGTLKASDLRPPLADAMRTIRLNMKVNADEIAPTLQRLQAVLQGAGPVERAANIKRRTAAHRARIAFARIREAGVPPKRLLSIHMAVAACIEDDPTAPRDREYRIVQVAKAVHRLASGTHGQWEWSEQPAATITRLVGGVRIVEHRPAVPARKYSTHDYPRSSGRVLRFIGSAIDECCAEWTEAYLELIRNRRLRNAEPAR